MDTARQLLDETEDLLQFGSWSWDVNSDLLTCTSGFCALLGYNSAEMDDKAGLDFFMQHIVEDDRGKFQAVLADALREKAGFSVEYVLKSSTGALKNISARGKLVVGENGEVLKVLCINRDITALLKLQKAQERNTRALNNSNKELEEFAYIASHDLQEPLRKISMFTERLKAKYDNTLDKEGELFISRIVASTANMRTLIENLLDFSRVNRRTHPFEQVSLRTILDGVISDLEQKMAEPNDVIRISGVLSTVEAVPSELTQLFSNILSNSLKFRKAGVPVEINVRGSRVDAAEKQLLGLPGFHEYEKIEVEDNGIGFEPEYSEKIFRIFERLNGKTEYPGSGIGLAICKKIVEKHNGLISGKGVPEEGATLTVILPEKQL